MKVIFEDDKYFYYISDYNTINRGLIVNLSDHKDFSMVRGFSDIDFSNIPHLDDAEVLYHYRDDINNKRYPVYYEHDINFISKLWGSYYAILDLTTFTKDYTLVNLNLL